MKSRSIVSISHDTVSWHSANGSQGTVPFRVESSARELAELIDGMVRDERLSRDQLILGIPSSDIFFVNNEFDDTTLQNNAALTFALEEQLPIDAEEMIPLVVGSAQDQRVLVWRIGDRKGLLIKLQEEFGIKFTAIAPVELFVANHLLHKKSISKSTQLLVLNPNSTDSFLFKNGSVVGWSYLVGKGSESLSRKQHPILADKELLGSLPLDELPDSEFVLSRDQQLTAALADKNSNESGIDFSPNLEFPYHTVQSIWEPLLLATLCLLCCLGGNWLYRSMIVQQQQTETENAIVAEFRAMFPDRKINGAIPKLLDAELKAQKKANLLISHSQSSKRLLETTASFLRGVPNKMRFQFESISLREDSVVAEGRVKTFDDFLNLKQGFIEQGFTVDSSSKFAAPFILNMKHRKTETSGSQSSSDAAFVKQK